MNGENGLYKYPPMHYHVVLFSFRGSFSWVAVPVPQATIPMPLEQKFFCNFPSFFTFIFYLNYYWDKEGNQNPRLRKSVTSRWREVTGKSVSRVLCSVAASSIPKRQGRSKSSAAKAHEDNRDWSISHARTGRELGLFSPQEKAQEKCYQCLRICDGEE